MEKKNYMTQICIKYDTLTCSQNKSQSSNVPSLTIWKMMTKQTADYMIYQVMKKKGGNATITI